MKIINLTPHAVNLCDKNGNVYKSFSMPKKGTLLPRLISEGTFTIIHGVPIGVEKYGEIVNFPAPKIDTYYIVSFLVNSAARKQGRNDTLFPAGEMFRDEKGRIKGMSFLASSF